MTAFTASYQMIAPDVTLGRGVRLSSFVNLYGCTIGAETTIGAFVEVQRDVVIGTRCKISSHTFVCTGVTIEDGCFIGHGVMFTNDRLPRAVNRDGTVQSEDDWELITTRIGAGVSIGSGSTILPGIVIGAGAMIGAGSVVTGDIPPGMLAYGVPARVVGPAPDRPESG